MREIEGEGALGLQGFIITLFFLIMFFQCILFNIII